MPRYLIYDVFTDTPFGGNPLAVLPEAAGIPEEALQRIAREFNLSETVFLYPPADPQHTAKLRIFTPVAEVPFAGHPTIGAAVALRALGAPEQMTLELGVGALRSSAAVGAAGGTATFTTPHPLTLLAAPPPALVAECLTLSTDDLLLSPHPPTLASLGLPFVLTALRDASALSRATPALPALQRAAARYPAGRDFALFCYTRARAQGPGAWRVEARMFSPLDGVPEDPATGSAAATLAALLARLEGDAVSLEVSQGAHIGRPSRICVSTSPAGVSVSGAAVLVMEGRLLL